MNSGDPTSNRSFSPRSPAGQLPRNSSWADYSSIGLPSRSVCCQLFLPLVRNPRVCLVCGGPQSQHHPPQTQNSTHYSSELNRPPNCPYDIRAEFVPKSSWKAKFGPRIPIVLGDDNYVTVGQKEPNLQIPLSLSTESMEGLQHNSDTLRSLDEGLRNPIMLSPSASSAFEDYRIHKVKNSSQNSPETNSGDSERRRSSVQFKTDDCVIGYEGGKEYFDMSENEVSSLSSDSTSDNDYDNLSDKSNVSLGRDNCCTECEETHKNTEFNSDQKNFQLAPASKARVANGKSQQLSKSENCLGSVEREIDKEIDKILGTSHKLQSIEGKLKDNSSVSNNNLSEPIVPIPVKPRGIEKHGSSGGAPQSCALMKSKSAVASGTATSYRFSVNKDENKTTIAIQEDEEMRPHSAKPDFVPPLVLTSAREEVNGDDSLAESSHRYSISPSPGRDLSEASSNLSTGRKSVERPDPNGILSSSQQKLVVKEMTPTKSLPKRKINRTNEHVEEKLRAIGKDLEKSVAFATSNSFIEPPETDGNQKPVKKPPPPPPKTYLNALNGYTTGKNRTLTEKSVSITSVPQLLNGKFNNFDESLIDIGVCKHISRHMPPRPASQEPLESETRKSRRTTRKFSSLRKLLPKFERSSSQPTGSFKKVPGGARASFSIPPGSPYVGKNKTAGPGIAALFHSMEDACCAADELAVSSEADCVIVREISETGTKLKLGHQQETTANGKQSVKEKKQDSATKPNSLIKEGLNLNQHLTVASQKYSHHFKASTDTVSSIFSCDGDISEAQRPNLLRSASKRNLCTNPEKRRQMEDKYNQMALSHMSTLSFIAEHMEEMGRKQRNIRWFRTRNPHQLTWADFHVINRGAPVLLKETSVFYKAVLHSEDQASSSSFFNLMVSPMRYSYPVPGNVNHPFLLPVLAEFQDRVPNRILRNSSIEEEDSGSESAVSTEENRTENYTFCQILVLPGSELATLDSFADMTSNRHHPLKLPFLHERETCFIMLQLLSCLKFIQSEGVEEVGSDLDCFLLFLNPDSSTLPRLGLLWESLFNLDEEDSARLASDMNSLSLCQCALGVLCMLLHTEVPTEEILKEHHVPLFSRITPYSEGFQKVAEVLQQEKACSLSKAKNILDYMFWISFTGEEEESQADSGMGMTKSDSWQADFSGTGRKFDSEFSIRLWLDVERARTVHRTVRTLVRNSQTPPLDLVDQYRIGFLLHASAKQLYEASLTLDSHKDVLV